MRRTWILAVVLTTNLAGVALASGPAKGSSPMLSIQPANRTGDAYCVTCESGQDPSVVAFLTQNDEASQKLLVALSEQAERRRDQHLTVTAIVIGEGAVPQALVDYVKEHELAVPLAVLPSDAEGLDDWQLSDQVHNTVVFLNHHKVDHAATNLSPYGLDQEIHDLLRSKHAPPRHKR